MAMRMTQAVHRLQSLRPAQLAASTRGFAGFDERERGEEEAKQLEKLLEKMKKAPSSPEAVEASGSTSSDEAKLKAILGENTDPATLTALQAWKQQAK